MKKNSENGMEKGDGNIYTQRWKESCCFLARKNNTDNVYLLPMQIMEAKNEWAKRWMCVACTCVCMRREWNRTSVLLVLLLFVCGSVPHSHWWEVLIAVAHTQKTEKIARKNPKQHTNNTPGTKDTQRGPTKTETNDTQKPNREQRKIPINIERKREGRELVGVVRVVFFGVGLSKTERNDADAVGLRICIVFLHHSTTSFIDRPFPGVKEYKEKQTNFWMDAYCRSHCCWCCCRRRRSHHHRRLRMSTRCHEAIVNQTKTNDTYTEREKGISSRAFGDIKQSGACHTYYNPIVFAPRFAGWASFVPRSFLFDRPLSRHFYHPRLFGFATTNVLSYISLKISNTRKTHTTLRFLLA